jgi:energy-coupling factor transporter transmembrane protein EcfT
MDMNDFLSKNNETTEAKADVLYVTNKSIRFGDDVYQFRNVTGFGIGKVQRKLVPLTLIIFIFFLSFLAFFPQQYWLGIILFLLAIGLIVRNVFAPNRYGLKIYLNSGDSQIFITTDTPWIKRAVTTLYDFIENATEGNYMNIQVGGDITGNFMPSSTVGGTVSNHVSKTNTR